MSRNKILSILLIITIIVLVVTGIIYREHLNAENLKTFLDQTGNWSPLIFVFAYAIFTIGFLPGSLLTITGGLLFGLVGGTLLSLTGATLGAIFSFLIARFVASDWVEKKSGPRLKALTDGVEAEGWRFVAFVRLVPIFPFNLLNYALGLTKIKLHHYILATFICMAPGALAYTYIGFIGREALEGKEGMLQKIIWGIALFAIVAFLPKFIKRFKKGE